MGVIHDPPYRPTKGKFRIIRAIPENIGSCMLQMSVAKMTGQRARRSTIAGVGLVAKVRKMFPVCPFRPNAITWLVCRHCAEWTIGPQQTIQRFCLLGRVRVPWHIDR